MTGQARPSTNPFPGLRPFLESEEHLFFGRENQVDEMVNKLADLRFLAVVGTSGSGKSSLVNCGLRPALHQGRMASAGTSWRMAQFRPGNHPISALSEALAEDGVLFHDFTERGLPLVEIIDTTLRMSKRGLLDIVDQAGLAEGINLLVVVDQFEELFRYRQLSDGTDADGYGFSEESTAFVKLLLELREEKACRIYVVLTMRSDFLGDCTQFAGLAEAINAGLFLVPRLTPEERREAIVNPIRVQGAEIDSVLTTRLVNDVGDNPDQLSILQHALNRTWANWQAEGNNQLQLNLHHYEAIGTMERALDAHAEEAYRELSGPGREPTDRQRICKSIFQALTDKATDGRGVRRPTTLAILCALAEASEEELTAVINVFRHPSRSFLMPPAGEPLSKEKVIDISHESLMRVWERLKGWVQEEAQAAQTYRRLSESAELHASGQASTLRDPELTIYQAWRTTWKPNRTWAERYVHGFDRAMAFLLSSMAERDAEQAELLRRQQEEARRSLEEANRARIAAEERQRLLRRGLIGMGAFASLAVAAGGFAGWQLWRAKLASATAFAATAKAQLSGDPFGALVNGLAALGPLANEPAASFEVSQILSSAVSANWQIGSMDSRQGTIYTLMELDNNEWISGGRNGTLRRWRDGKPIGKPIQTEQQRVWKVLKLRNGDWVTAGHDGSLRFWRNGKAIGQSIPTGQGNLVDLVELGNGEIISSGYKKTLRRWRMGKSIGGTIPTNQDTVWKMVVLSNGDLLTAGNDGSLQRRRNGMPVGNPIATNQGSISSLIELTNGEWVSGGSDGTLRRWRDGQPLGQPMISGQKDIESLLELRDGELISGSDDGTLRRWKHGKPISAPIPTGHGGVSSLLQLSNGELISGGRNGLIRRWRRGEKLGGVIQTGQGSLIVIKLRNGELLSGGGDGTLQRWRDGKPVGKRVQTDQGGVAAILERKDSELVTAGANGTLRRWRSDGKPVGGSIPTGQGFVRSLAELADGDLISAGEEGTLRRWRNGKQQGSDIKTKDGEAWGLLVLKNGELISSGNNGTIERWRSGSGSGRRIGDPIATGQGGIWSLIELNSGDLLSGGGDGSLKLWQDGKQIGATINTGQSAIWSLLELKNGELISGSIDGSIRRWREGKSVGEAIQTGQGTVLSLIEADNGELITAGKDGTLRRWLVVRDVVKAACMELRDHPALATPQTPSEEEASATCTTHRYLK